MITNEFLDLLNELEDNLIDDRKHFAAKAFNISSHYDTAIFNLLQFRIRMKQLKLSVHESKSLRYGENPHQKGNFLDLRRLIRSRFMEKKFHTTILLDIDAAVN